MIFFASLRLKDFKNDFLTQITVASCTFTGKVDKVRHTFNAKRKFSQPSNFELTSSMKVAIVSTMTLNLHTTLASSEDTTLSQRQPG